MLNLEVMLKRIEHLLVDREMTVTELGRKAGLPPNSLTNWWRQDRKRFPQADDLFAVAETLGVSVDYLMTGVAEKNTMSARNLKILRAISTLDEENIKKVLEYIDLLLLRNRAYESLGGREGTA